MKTSRYILALICISLIFGSCATSERIVVMERPAPPVVVRSAPPQPGWVWIGGEWVWKHRMYVYQPGYWVSPRVGFIWQHGHWQHVRHGWIWVRGRWRAV